MFHLFGDFTKNSKSLLLKDFNKYVARLSYLARLGEGAVSYAVYMPMRDIWAGGNRAKKWVDVFDKTVKALEKAHCPVDIIDDDFLETASVEGNALSTGTAKYTTLVMLKGADISESAKEKLKQFKDAGGNIIYDDELLKAEPMAEISSENVSLFKRILSNGVLYFLQNESAEEEKVSVSFFEKGNIQYRGIKYTVRGYNKTSKIKGMKRKVIK